jgi:exodeoxyribonuclease V alpha subunit
MAAGAGDSLDDTLEGTLERFVYRASGSPFAVARLRPADGEVATVVGSLAALAIGAPVRLHGRWEQDRKHGRQFRAASYQTLEPTTLAGIERYLGSGAVPGIGGELAKRIVARFGLDTLEVIHRHPERLVEVEGIGPVRAQRIRGKWQEMREVEDVMVFLAGHGVSPRFAERIYKRYGAATIALVRENPYRLALEVWGIGFRSADAVAEKLGIARDAPARAEAGLLHVLGELTAEGNVHVPEHELIHRAEQMLEVGAEILEPAADRLAASRHVVREALGDRGPCLSLRALWEAEVRAAQGLARLAAGGPAAPGVPDELVERGLASFERDQGIALAPEQREAVRAAVRGRVTVITGGPGVGKTTIVNAVIRLLEARLRRVALGAPTGRAAKRLAETTGRPAMTLHRLLEFSPQNGRFLRDEAHPLDADAVIVDEASMLDVPLAAQLLAAIPAGAQLVLVGDVDQLPSVGPGRVLADVIASRAVTVVRLTEIFRQAASSAIVVNAHRVNRGELPDVRASIAAPDFFFIEREEPAEVVATILEVVAERIPRRFQLDPVDDVQVLAPMHRGEAGAQNLNLALQARLNPARPGAGELQIGRRTFRVGDKVIQNRNDYEKEVFNGDVGRIVAIGDDGEVTVAIDGRAVRYPPAELDQIGHAFALSVHKAQGSEYPAVVVPLLTQHYLMLRRNLLYTAMTRGKRLVVLVGTRKALGIAVRTDDTRLRWTWLAQRIRDALAGALAAPAQK